jgi:hypothetical protein
VSLGDKERAVVGERWLVKADIPSSMFFFTNVSLPWKSLYHSASSWFPAYERQGPFSRPTG